MLLSGTSDLVRQLVELGDESTTLFMESLRGSRLLVEVEHQDETQDHLIRVVRLFFDNPGLPLLYCKSRLCKWMLRKEEYEALCEGRLPIGIVFNLYNDVGSIRKTNIEISTKFSPSIAAQLHVTSPSVFEKKCLYRVGDRDIGMITEYFNEESLSRL